MRDPRADLPDHQGLLRQALADDPRDAAAPDAPAPPRPQDLAARFPDYDVHELIGRGGMGAVYRATQRSLDRQVAIKVLPAERARDPEFGERFLREARALAALDHPGILTVYDYGDRDGLFYLVTEFVDGVDLRRLMSMGELSPAEALRIAPQICSALQFAHERGVVHRDIKPENILIDGSGRVKIADFGLAKLAARAGDPVALTRHSAVLGTPHYMAPEQWRGGDGAVDHRADIYSLGVVLYEMLTGQLPLGHFELPSRRRGVPRGLDQIVQRALAQRPENRYQHASEVRDDVERQARSLDARAPAASASPRRSEDRPSESGAAAPYHAADARLHPGPVAAFATVALAVGAASLWIFLIVTAHQAHRRYESDLVAYATEALAAGERLRSGIAIGAPPPLPSPPDAARIDEHAALAMMLGLVGGAVLLVLAFGVGGLRGVRNAMGARRGLLGAVVAAWLVPLAAADALAFAPLSLIRSGDLQTIAGIFLGLLLLAGNVWLLRWQYARHRAMLRAAIPWRRGGGWLWGAGTLGALLLGAAAASPLVLRPDAHPTAAVRGPVFAQHLVGRPMAFVRRRLGPPSDVVAGAASRTWTYPGVGADGATGTLTFSGGTVAAFDVDAPVLQPNPEPEGPSIGDPIAAFVAAIGPPSHTVHGTVATRFEFADGTVLTVVDGIVVGASR